jgi:hypothetical protein
MLGVETIHFANEHEALLVHVRRDTPVDEIIAAASADWMKKTTREQVEKLPALLAKSPLKKLPNE